MARTRSKLCTGLALGLLLALATLIALVASRQLGAPGARHALAGNAPAGSRSQSGAGDTDGAPGSAALVAGQQPAAPATQYWHRPGCHRVGHTRLIAIPGCVMFNLSTNACRGYCLSYSIPANDELPAPVGGAGGFLAGGLGTFGAAVGEPEGRERPPSNNYVAGGAGNPGGNTNGNPGEPADELARSRAGGQLESGGARRDVVSVSQCCGMIETEDVIVNLRCGTDEIRPLTFKSAKSCECFFCKHT